MTRELARLADLAEKDPDAALARLREMKWQALARKRRVAAKRAPRKRQERSESAAAIARRVEIRREVFGRCGGRCECCGSKTPAELHHLVSGPSRRVRESVETCAAVCVWCHVDLHRGKVEALGHMYAWAVANNYREAWEALRRRLDKINEARSA